MRNRLVSFFASIASIIFQQEHRQLQQQQLPNKMTTAKNNNSSIQELEVSFPGYIAPESLKEYGDDYSFNLSGTLRMPSIAATTSPTHDDDKKKYPAAIIVHGSGPIDRDGNAITPFPLPNMALNTHNKIAEHLVSENQMVVLCYDKRGINQSTTSQNKDLYYDSGMYDLIYDVIQAYKYLVEKSKEYNIDIHSIYLIGHSEGAILLPLIAELLQNEENPSAPIPKGLVFIAGFGETLPNAVQKQQDSILNEVESTGGIQGFILKRLITREKLTKQQDEFLEQVNIKDQNYYKQYCGFVKVPTKWYREHLQWDTLKSLKECTTIPILAITGSKDVQVKSEYCESENAKMLAPSSKDLQTFVVRNMTHILRTTTEEPSIINLQKDYAKQAKQPLNEEFLTILSKWFQEQQERK